MGWAVAIPIMISIGTTVLSYVLRPKSHSDTVGPRLDELHVQSSAYGETQPIPFATKRYPCNIIWAKDLDEHKKTVDYGHGNTVTTYSYTGSFAIGICEGPVEKILRIWADSKLVYDAYDQTANYLRKPIWGDSTNPGWFNTILLAAAHQNDVPRGADDIRMYLGTEDQQPDPMIEAAVGIGNCPAHRGLVYVVVENLELGDFGNRIPTFTVEVSQKTVPPPKIASSGTLHIKYAYTFDPAYQGLATIEYGPAGILQWNEVVLLDGTSYPEPRSISANISNNVLDAINNLTDFTLLFSISGSLFGDGNSVFKIYDAYYDIICTDGTHKILRPGNIRTIPYGSGTIVNEENAGDADADTFATITRTHFSGVGYSPYLVLEDWNLNATTVAEKYPATDERLDLVVESLCLRTNLIGTPDIDTTDLQRFWVHGFSHDAQGPARASIENLAQIYPFDCCESDHKLKFVARGKTHAAVVPESDLMNVDSDPEKMCTIVEQNTDETEIPAEVDLVFSDLNRDYQEGTQIARRSANPVATMGSREPTKITTNVVMNAWEARSACDVILYEQWASRLGYEFKLMPKWVKLDASDVILVGLNMWRTKLIRMDLGYEISCNGVSDDPRVYELSYANTSGGVPVPEPGGETSNTEVVPGGDQFLVVED